MLLFLSAQGFRRQKRRLQSRAKFARDAMVRLVRRKHRDEVCERFRDPRVLLQHLRHVSASLRVSFVQMPEAIHERTRRCDEVPRR